jgi:uncharacterized protein YndB with AHSA1/START domain
VGVIAQLAGMRQPQATKHLQVLESAGLVASFRFGRRRVHALESAPLRELATLFSDLADSADTARGDREVLDVYRASVEAERLAADRDHWADGRLFALERVLDAPRDVVWAHWARAELMRLWWAPPPLRVSECVFDARPGGRVVLEYREADDSGDDADGVVGRAEGVVDAVVPGSRIAFHSSPLMPDGTVAFTGHYSVALDDAPTGTRLDLRLRITDSTVAAADFIAGLELGWRQVLDNLAAVLATAEMPLRPAAATQPPQIEGATDVRS